MINEILCKALEEYDYDALILLSKKLSINDFREAFNEINKFKDYDLDADNNDYELIVFLHKKIGFVKSDFALMKSFNIYIVKYLHKFLDYINYNINIYNCDSIYEYYLEHNLCKKREENVEVKKNEHSHKQVTFQSVVETGNVNEIYSMWLNSTNIQYEPKKLFTRKLNVGHMLLYDKILSYLPREFIEKTNLLDIIADTNNDNVYEYIFDKYHRDLECFITDKFISSVLKHSDVKVLWMISSKRLEQHKSLCDNLISANAALHLYKENVLDKNKIIQMHNNDKIINVNIDFIDFLLETCNYKFHKNSISKYLDNINIIKYLDGKKMLTDVMFCKYMDKCLYSEKTIIDYLDEIIENNESDIDISTYNKKHENMLKYIIEYKPHYIVKYDNNKLFLNLIVNYNFNLVFLLDKKHIILRDDIENFKLIIKKLNRIMKRSCHNHDINNYLSLIF